MAIFKSNIEKMKEMFNKLTDEEKEELKKSLLGEAEEEETEEDSNDETVEETEQDETIEESATEEESTEEETEEAPSGEEEQEVTEDAAESAEEEAPSEEAPIEESEETTEEETLDEAPVTEEEAPAPDPRDERIAALETQVTTLMNEFNNITEKVTPILEKFAQVDNDQPGAGMDKPQIVSEGDEAGMSAHEFAMSLAKY